MPATDEGIAVVPSLPGRDFLMWSIIKRLSPANVFGATDTGESHYREGTSLRMTLPLRVIPAFSLDPSRRLQIS